MSLESIGRLLIAAALVLLVVGGVLIAFGRLGVLKLPGDIVWRRGNFTFFFPIVTTIVISLILTAVLNLIVWLWQR